MRKILQRIAEKLRKFAKIREKTPFLALSVFRPADRNFGRNVSADFDRNFGRNFGFGRTLLTTLQLFKVSLKYLYNQGIHNNQASNNHIFLQCC